MTIHRGDAEYVGTYKAGSPQWHAARAEGLGGSEIAAVMGLSPYESRFSLWHRKAGLLADEPEDELMELGSVFEEPISELFRRRNSSVRVSRTGTWRNRQRPWQIANPDRLADGRPLEIKYAPYSDGWGAADTDEIPVYYRCQVLWYLDVFGYQEALLAALVAGQYRQYRIGYDADDALLMRGAAEKFLASLHTGDRPDIDEHSATYATVRALHPDIDREDIEVDTTIAAPYLAAVNTYRAAEAEKQRCSAALLDAMGTARRALWAGDVIATRRPARGGAVALYPAKHEALSGQEASAAA